MGSVIVDTNGVATDSVRIPDSLAYSVGTRFTGHPASQRVAFWSGRAAAVAIVDFALRTTAPLLHSQDPLVPLSWTIDGSLVLASGEGYERRQLYRIPAGSARAVKLMDLPEDCRGSLAISRDRRKVACVFQRWKPDVWLAELIPQ